MGLCSLPVVWPEAALSWSLQSPWQGYRLYGRTNGDFLQEDLGQQAVPPRIAAANAPDPVAGHCQPMTSREIPKTLADKSGSVLVEPRLLSPASWCSKGFVCVLQESLFSQSWGSSIVKSCWPAKLDSLGIPSPFDRSPGGEVCCGAWNLCESMRIREVKCWHVCHLLLSEKSYL